MRRAENFILFAAILVFSLAAFSRNFVWTDGVSFWRDAAGKSPHEARPLNNLGSALMTAGRYDEAIAELKNSVKADPWYPESHFNLGVCYLKKGLLDDAIPEFDKVIGINAVLKGGHFGEAFSPRNEVGAHANLGNIYNVKGMLGEAVSHYKEAIAISKDDASVRFNLAITYKRLGMLKEAKAEFEEVLRIDPSDEGARQNLSIIGGR